MIGQPIERDYTLADLLRRPDVRYALCGDRGPEIGRAPALGSIRCAARAGVEQIEIQSKYAGYIARQQVEVARHEHNEDAARFPPDFDYAQVRGLSNEVRQRLAAAAARDGRPGVAVSGVTPAAISLLLVYLKKRRARHPGGLNGQRPACGLS